MKYQSELIKDIVDTRGHEKSSLHYESECIETWIEETKGAYPKLCDYESEWLNYITLNEIGKFPYETVTANPTASINNVVPYAYKRATLKGSTKYRDIDTGDVLDTFDETKNLELVSVKVPGLTTTGKNLFNKENIVSGVFEPDKLEAQPNSNRLTFTKNNAIKVKPNTPYTLSSATGYKCGVIALNATKTSTTINSGWKDTSNGYTFTTDANTHYVTINISKTDDSIIQPSDKDTLNLMVEQGTVATPYEPYKSNILSTPTDLELRGIGDVQDTLDCLTGELTQRIGEVVLDGSENWIMDTNGAGANRYFLKGIGSDLSDDISNSSSLLCDKFKASSNNIWFESNDSIQIVKSSGLYIIDSSIDSLDAFVNKLKTTNIKVQYSIIEKPVKTVDLTITNQDGETLDKIKPHEGTMNINVTGNPITPIGVFEIPVEAITQNLSSFIEEE